MRLALLGLDSESDRLARAAATLGHTIIWAADLGDLPGDWAEVRQDDDQWLALCDTSLCDGVIVGRGQTSSDKRLEQLLQLAKSGTPLLTSFPLFDSLLAFYELDLARGEAHSILHHYSPVVPSGEWITQTAEWIALGHPELGASEQLLWERPLADRVQAAVFTAFARDVELLDRLAGPIDRLGAVGAADQGNSYAGLNVQLLSKRGIPVLWNVTPGPPQSTPTLTLVGAQGKKQIEVPCSPEDRHTQAFEAVARFCEAVAGERHEASTWDTALRAMELADTIEISLRRGRIIDVHRQQLTEELSFRGTMSAVGCGALLVLPPLLLVVGWLAEKLNLPLGKNTWAFGLLVVLLVFLLFQLLPKLLLRNSPAAEVSPDGEGDDAS